MFCWNCGFDMDDSKLCSNCGTGVKTSISHKPKTHETYAHETDNLLLAQFVGKNSEFYLRKWQSFEEPSIKSGWNWAAFFFTGIWFAYRKMYISMAIYYVMWIVALIAAQFVHWATLPTILGIVFSLFCGKKGNSIYYTFSKMKIFDFSNKKNEVPLQKQGGTSWLGLIGALLISFAIVVTLEFISLLKS